MAKKKAGAPRRGAQARKMYSFRLEPQRAEDIARLYGKGKGKSGADSLSAGIDAMFERLEKDRKRSGSGK